MGFPLAGQPGQIFFTTSFPKLSKGYDKGYGVLPRSTNHTYGSLADTEVVFRQKRFLKQVKRHEGHGRGARNRPFLLASAAMDAEGVEFSEVADTNFTTAVAKKEMANDMESLRTALVSAETRAMVAERAKAEALEALARAEAKRNEYAASLLGTSEIVVGEFLSVKLSLGEELDRILKEKLGGNGEVMITKCEVADLVAELEKLTGASIQRAALRIAEEVNLRVAVTETSAAEAAVKVEERIGEASINAANLMITETHDAIHKSFSALDAAKDKAHKAEIALFQKMQILDDLVLKEAAALGLKQSTSQTQQKLQVAKTEIERLRAELKAVEARAIAAEARAKAADAALLESQEAGNRSTREHEENAKKALEALKKAGAARLEAVRATFKADIEVLEAAVRSVQMAEKAQDQAYLRRYQALESSLAAAEAAELAWKNRAIAMEDLVRRIKEESNEPTEVAGRVEGIVSGGRMEAFLHSESRKLELLADGPRRETPEWMARRIDYALQGLPPRKYMSEQAEAEAEAEAKVETDADAEVVLELPSPEDVWSIATAKVKEDVFTKQAAEKAKIDEQRQALERSLERTTPKSPMPFKVAEDGTKKLESGTGSGKEVVFQGFNWESWRRKWYLELAPKAADLYNSGITTVWFPPPTQSVAPQGYMPGDLYNLNSAYGTIEELKQSIEEMHKHKLLVLGDAVLNHRCAQKKGPNGVWNVFGGKLAWGPEAIVRDDPHFQGQGNPSSGDIFHAAPNIDHSQEFVRKDIKEWLQWLRMEIGFDGWRLDFVRGFWGGYVKEYIESSQPAFAIGEYWDSLTYEGGNVAYNQDAHRQRIINWINATGGTSSAFDVTTKGILHAALHNQYWRLIDPQGKPPGVIGWWPSRAVTFLENHDTGSTQGHWPFPRDKLMQGYAYILTHPGTPLVFYDHFYDFGLHDEIAELIQIRKRTGVHCRSPLKIHVANNEGYVAQVGDNLVVKLGSLDWNPSKQINIVGNWNKSVDKGGDYQVWEKS